MCEEGHRRTDLKECVAILKDIIQGQGKSEGSLEVSATVGNIR